MFYGNAMAISALAEATGDDDLAAEFAERASVVQDMYLNLLWNPDIEFFAVLKDGSPAKRGPENASKGIPFGFPKCN